MITNNLTTDKDYYTWKDAKIHFVYSAKDDGMYLYDAEGYADDLFIPNTINGITVKGIYGEDFCNGLSSFDKVVVSSDNTELKTLDGVLFSADGATMILYPPQKTDSSYTVPANVVTIGAGAFSSNKHIKHIDFCEGVEKIDMYALCWCENLTTVIMHNSVHKIGCKAFLGLDSIKRVCYLGTHEEWLDVSVSEAGNECIVDNMYYLSDEEDGFKNAFPIDQTKLIGSSIAKSKMETIARSVILNRVVQQYMSEDGESIGDFKSLEPFCTECEKKILTDISLANQVEMNSFGNQRFAIDILLWSVGLSNGYSCDEALIESDVLISIKSREDLNNVVSRCIYRNDTELESAYAELYIWYWRLWLCPHFDYSELTLKDVISEYIGVEYANWIVSKKIISAEDIDLKYKGVLIKDLSSVRTLKESVKWKLYAFQWITNDKLWGE